jgi:autotransporter-associated beta strand protein
VATLGTATLADNISGGLTKQGAGTLTISGRNTYTGETTVEAGTLQFNSASGIYTYSGSTVNIGNGATAQISGDRYDFNQKTFLFGTNGNGTLLNTSANFVNRTNTFRTSGGARNQINNSGAAFFNFDSGINTFDVVRGTDASSDLTVNAVMANAGSVLKTGNGILTLTAQNTYVGGTTVDAGTLVLNDSWNYNPVWSGIGVVRGNLAINQGATVALRGTGTGALGWLAGSQVTNLVINGGLLDGYSINADARQHIWNITGGVNLTGGQMRMNNGVSSTTTGNYWEWGNTAVNSFASADSSEISGRVNIRTDYSSTISFNVADGAAASDLIVSAAITQSAAGGAITKNGAGVMLLSGTNLYTGATTVNGGTLRAGSNAAFGSNSAVTLGNTVGVILDLAGFPAFCKLGAETLGPCQCRDSRMVPGPRTVAEFHPVLRVRQVGASRHVC